MFGPRGRPGLQGLPGTEGDRNTHTHTHTFGRHVSSQLVSELMLGLVMVLCLSSCLCAEVLDLFFVLPGQGVTGQKGYPGFPGEEGVAVSSSLTHVFIHPLIHSFTTDDD